MSGSLGSRSGVCPAVLDQEELHHNVPRHRTIEEICRGQVAQEAFGNRLAAVEVRDLLMPLLVKVARSWLSAPTLRRGAA